MLETQSDATFSELSQTETVVDKGGDVLLFCLRVGSRYGCSTDVVAGIAINECHLVANAQFSFPYGIR